MKKWMFIFLFTGGKLFSQSFTLDEVNALARQNYPLIRQQDLINRTRDISVDNLGKRFLPQVTFSGQATYQSEVTNITFPASGIKIEPLSRDQYKAVADVNQLVYDGGVIKQQKAVQELTADVQQRQVDVELYQLQDRINQLYLSVLFLDEQLKQTELVKNDLKTGIKSVEAQVNNGVAFRSNLNLLQAQLLQSEQRTTELAANRKGLLETIGLFINQSINEQAVFQRPASPGNVSAENIRRPELQLYSARQRLNSSQLKLIDANNTPRASVFFQGGYGKPALNFLENKFAFFYFTGLRFSWDFGGLYTSKKEREQVEINNSMVDVEKDLFLLNTNTQLKQQQADIEKMIQLIAEDNQIVDLRNKVTEAAKAQLENGVITANDFLIQVNAEDQARQARITHELQLLQARIKYQIISGIK